MSKNTLLKKIRSIQLSALLLALHLDVFPDDNQAQEDFKKASDKLDHLFVKYEKKFGPLAKLGSSYLEDFDIF